MLLFPISVSMLGKPSQLVEQLWLFAYLLVVG